LGTVLITIGAVGAAGGGVGGGGLYVPLLVIVIGFDTKEAVAVSQGSIVGAALAHFILNVPKKHPLMNIPLIDYSALLVLEPMLLAGSIFGVMVNEMLPSVMILIILVIVLSLGVFKTVLRALMITRSEQECKEGQISANDRIFPDEGEKNDNAVLEASSVAEAPVVSIIGMKYIMWSRLGMVAGLWLIVCCVVIVRGSTVGESSIAGIAYCSSEFWGITAAIPIVQIALSAWFGKLEIDRVESRRGSLYSPSSKALLNYTKVE